MINYNDLIGIPFKEEGDDCNGTNCYNLLRMAYSLHGIEIPKTNIAVCACKEASNAEIENHISKYWKKIDDPVEPCGVLILSTNPDFAGHIGTYIGNGKMLHITMNTNSIIERIYPKYKNKILGFYKFIGEK